MLLLERKMISLKLVQIGNSVGFVLPKEAASKLKVEKGDVVFLTESPDGYRISPYDPVFEKQMKAAERIMKKRRDVLRALAK
jgi:putative addiction module antidote